MSYCAFSGPVPGFLYPARGAARSAWRLLVYAMGNDFACPLPPGVTPDDNLTCVKFAPLAAPTAAPEQAAAAPEQVAVAPVALQKAALAAAAPDGAQATTELQSSTAPLADRCGVPCRFACMHSVLSQCLVSKKSWVHVAMVPCGACIFGLIAAQSPSFMYPRC